jgi:hypothetical protein
MWVEVLKRNITVVSENTWKNIVLNAPLLLAPVLTSVPPHRTPSQFPNANASVRASTFDAFVDRALPFADRLPIVTGEMGDTWIYGVPADPFKTAALREAMSARRACFDAGACSPIDERVYNFSRLLIKGVEHTWGGDTKKFLNDTEYAQWSNAAFDAMRKTSVNVAHFEQSWREQRVWALDAPLAALQDHPLAAEISKRWAALRRSVPRDPALLGFTQLTDPAQWSQARAIGMRQKSRASSQ